MYDSEIARHVTEFLPRTEPVVEWYDFPADFPPQFRRSGAFDERHAYRLRDVLVSPHTGLTWLPGGPILEESYGSLIRSLGWGDIRHEPLLRARRLSGGPIIAFAPTGYYHWLLEVLPAAIFALSIEPEALLLIPSRAPAYASSAAEQLVGPSRVVRSDDIVHVDSCVMAAIEPLSGFVQRAEIDRLRAAFASCRADTETIYISRLKDPRRALSNEADVERAMRAAGATVVYAQHLPFEEQRALFANARTVIAPHGAGLANLVWAHRAELVVEVFPAASFNDCYARLSRNLGIDYAYVVASPADEGAGVVPVDRLTAALDAVRFGNRG
ncbi:glycosyltransferase family 61 protein [Actinacidiphila oryziradicis]|uniref:glycosyltransferase family 61 protein n=1 Tax=Actinacidiphila oryziradicis TaxID=2571141 RepID=UPI0023F4BB11|nr:glycosyltransferase family 61 protein [Actinacidiphila oryziradicis]